jgi:hypothetical protein
MSQDNSIQEPQETVEEVVEQAPVEVQEQNVDSSQVTQQEKPVQRESRYEKLNKSYNELRSNSDRRYNEALQQQKQLQSELQFFAPYKEALKKALDEKKAQEQAALYQQNPMEAQRRMAEEIAAQKIAPIQQRYEQMEAVQQTNEVVNYLQQNYGTQAFEAMKAPMAQVLTNVTQNAGPQAAQLLARNPDTLMEIAVGQAYLAQIKSQRQAQVQGNQNQQKATRFAQGTAKPVASSNKNVTSFDNMTDAQLEAAAYAEMAQKYKNK